MTPDDQRSIEHERKVIETMRGWKRDARKLLRVTPESVTEFDASMDRIIARSRARIARLERTDGD